MKRKKERTARGFLRMTVGLIILCAALNCCKYETHAETIDVRVVGRSWYGVANLMVEKINEIRNQYKAPSIALDAGLQEWATQMSAELSFCPGMGESKIRPDGTSVKDTLITDPMIKIFIIDGDTGSATDEMFMDGLFDRVVSLNPNILGDIFTTKIGIGLYQDKSSSSGRLHLVFLLGKDAVNQGEAKSTVESEVRTISTIPSNFKLCNGKERVDVSGVNLRVDRITLEENESRLAILLQHASDGRHFSLDGTQAVYHVKDPSIASVEPTVNGIKVTGLKEGKTTFTASMYGQKVTYHVIVEGKKNDQETAAKTPSVKSLKDLPKSYKGEAVVGGKKLYVENRKKVTGEREVGGTTYYFKNGEKFTGTKGTYYYKDGVKYTGWLKKGGKKYYYSKGRMVKNRRMTIKKKKYYFNKKGVMQKNKWVKIGKYKYFFNKKGVQTEKKKA